jgi:hypothetical protein
MMRIEYILSLLFSLIVLGGALAMTQNGPTAETALSCRPGRAAAPVVLKGMSIYPRCPGGGKRG